MIMVGLSTAMEPVTIYATNPGIPGMNVKP